METLELRAVERILAVLIGGLCIYLGYRLFGAVPEQTNGEGRISFADHASVYVNRVGPGVFFALFGATVVGASLFSQVILERTERAASERTETARVAPSEVRLRYATAQRFGDDAALESARLELLRDLRALSAFERRLEEGGGGGPLALTDRERLSLLVALAHVRRASVAAVWADDWGDYPSFDRWARAPAPAEPPRDIAGAASFFEAASLESEP